jgi:flavin-dependent dehydrogenase
VIVRLGDKWFWLIPLSKEKVSVGCVLDQEELCGRKPPAVLFERIWRSSAAMRERMGRRRRFRRSRRRRIFRIGTGGWWGPRLLRVGDAAGFMDPIFSAGVYLAMTSGQQRGAGGDGVAGPGGGWRGSSEV